MQTAPALRVQQSLSRLAISRQRLATAAASQLAGLRSRADVAARTLHSVSPLATLERGYAIVTDSASGEILSDAAQTGPGTTLTARLAKGRVHAVVDSIETDDD